MIVDQGLSPLDDVVSKFGELISVDSRFGYLLRVIFEKLSSRSNPPVRGVSDLSEVLGLPVAALTLWINGIPNEYKYEHFKIAKKNGRGYRNIDAPNSILKSLQRSVYHKLLKPLSVHRAATAYIPKKSIFDNALPHVGQKVVINIDLKDFFGSITSSRVYRCWHFFGWDVTASMILKNICCYKGRLPQGAPTSPALSNLCNQLLDTRLEELANQNSGQYTRYSDDLTFSFSKPDIHKRGVLNTIHKILSSEEYEIQKKKRIRVQRPHQRQTATGLVVNEKVNLPREVRKRIRAMRHHRDRGTLSTQDEQRLKGYESLILMLSNVNEVNKPSIPKRIELNRLVPASSTSFGTSDICDISRILFLASNPADQVRLRLDEESREIDEGLRRAHKREQFQLKKRMAVRTDDLRRAMLDENPHIVHFSGHGYEDEGIVLENSDGTSTLLSADALANLFELFSENVECVLLNACYSEGQAIAISQHINYVIGMNQDIGDKAAIKFSVGFYDALGAGKSIETAFKFGCNAIELEGLPEHLIPTIRKRPQLN